VALPDGVDGALAVLVEKFAPLAGPFAGCDDEGRLDLGSLVGKSGIVLTRHGVFLRLGQQGREEVRFGSESVIVLEILASLGNELALHSENEDLKRAWRSVVDGSEILPMPVNDWTGDGRDDTTLAEAVWYSDRIGQDVEYYVSAAKWLRARQYLYAMKQLSAEPTREEYDFASELVLPPPEEIDILVAAAAAGFGQDVEEFVRDAVSDRNISVRQEVVFKRWYGLKREDSIPSP
jgi:hypothetical protein